MRQTKWRFHTKLLVLPIMVGLFVIFFSKQSPEQVVLPFNTCPLPCFMGIVPGETTFSEAYEIIESTIPSSQLIWEGYFWIRDDEGTTLYVTIERTDPRAGSYVKSINISSHSVSQVVNLGSIISSGYSPQRVFRNRTHGPNALNLLIVFGADMNLMAQVCAIGAVSPNSSVCDLTIAAPQDKDWVLQDIQVTQHYDYEISWLGFDSRENYLETAAR